MKAADIARGAYHFYVPNVNPQAQADFFCSFVDSVGATDMPPMLDLEGSGIGGLTTETYMEQVLQWLSAVEKRFGRTPIIYVDNPFANQYLTDPHFARYPLWVAEYGPVAHIPHTWANSGKRWIIWQHTAREKMIGIDGVTDGDLLVGNARKLFP